MSIGRIRRFNKSTILFAAILVAFAVSHRSLDYPPNFSPLGAVALFSGLWFGRRWAIVVPLAAMFVSDLAIGMYEPAIMASVYASFAIIALIGTFVNKFYAKPAIGAKLAKYAVFAGSSLTGSVIFFTITNFAVWQFGSWYPRTLAGLAQCYAMAIPFFHNTVLGDLFFGSLFFGLWVLAESVVLNHQISNTNHQVEIRIEDR